MTSRLRRAIALAAMLGACRNEAAPAELPKQSVYVLTSLPLLFDEGFALEPAKGEAASFLRGRFTLKPVDLPSQLPARGVLLAAQPRALPAEELVALDTWVRGGGRLVLLADPMLEWPSERPFGDRLRPPVSFADTGLLGHWGLRLDAPDERGLKVGNLNGGPRVALNSPGRLVKVGGNCTVEHDGASAACSIGEGHVLIVADADWLNIEALRTAGAAEADNLNAVASLLGTAGGARK